ncbi:aspartate aminotransferase family protein, partial [Burkholderia thailandensis]
MSYRLNNESAWIQPAAPAPGAHAHRTSAEYRALDAAHHIHPFSDMGSLNRAGS